LLANGHPILAIELPCLTRGHAALACETRRAAADAIATAVVGTGDPHRLAFVADDPAIGDTLHAIGLPGDDPVRPFSANRPVMCDPGRLCVLRSLDMPLSLSLYDTSLNCMRPCGLAFDALRSGSSLLARHSLRCRPSLLPGSTLRRRAVRTGGALLRAIGMLLRLVLSLGKAATTVGTGSGRCRSSNCKRSHACR
jgi:hypothetical protein